MEKINNNEIFWEIKNLRISERVRGKRRGYRMAERGCP